MALLVLPIAHQALDEHVIKTLPPRNNNHESLGLTVTRCKIPSVTPGFPKIKRRVPAEQFKVDMVAKIIPILFLLI